jgi:hypothetical protein
MAENEMEQKAVEKPLCFVVGPNREHAVRAGRRANTLLSLAPEWHGPAFLGVRAEIHCLALWVIAFGMLKRISIAERQCLGEHGQLQHDADIPEDVPRFAESSVRRECSRIVAAVGNSED